MKNDEKVTQALNTLSGRAYDIGRYFVTIDQVGNCRSRDYQRNYNRFYRVRRGAEWQSVYYEILLREYGNKPSFAQVITEMYERTGNIEPSFSSKLVATLDTDKPVWVKKCHFTLSRHRRMVLRFPFNRGRKTVDFAI